MSVKVRGVKLNIHKRGLCYFGGLWYINCLLHLLYMICTNTTAAATLQNYKISANPNDSCPTIALINITSTDNTCVLYPGMTLKAMVYTINISKYCSSGCMFMQKTYERGDITKSDVVVYAHSFDKCQKLLHHSGSLCRVCISC